MRAAIAAGRRKTVPVKQLHLRGMCSELRRRFLDCVRIQAQGGRGGHGVVSFEQDRRGRMIRAGGTGGQGGSVVLRAIGGDNEFRFSNYVFKASDGQNASGAGKHGRRARDIYVHVPAGTVVKSVERTYLFEGPWNAEDLGWAPMGSGRFEDDSDSDDDDGADAADADDSESEGDEESSAIDRVEAMDQPVLTSAQRRRRRRLLALEVGSVRPLSRGGAEGDRFELPPQPLPGGMGEFQDTVVVLADLDRPGQEYVAARGGLPGRGNLALGKQEEVDDGINHVHGEDGEHVFLELELKSIADVGLVGFPNAGKSTLLSRISKARPKIASYPFTTLKPTVGVVEFPDEGRLSVADIPGLVRGAAENRGLGHEFLRHIERTSVLGYVVDAAGAARSAAIEAAYEQAVSEAVEARALAGGVSGELAAALASLRARAEQQRHESGGGGDGREREPALSLLEQEAVQKRVRELLAEEFGDDGLGSIAKEEEVAGLDGGLLGSLGTSPVQDLRTLQEELARYSPEMADKPAVVFANKADLPEAAAGIEELRAHTSLPVIPISAKQAKGLGPGMDALRFLVEGPGGGSLLRAAGANKRLHKLQRRRARASKGGRKAR